MGDIIEIATFPNHRNTFYKISSGGFKFEVKAAVCAELGLAKQPGNECDVWIVIGRSGRTWIRRTDHPDLGKLCTIQNILNGTEYRQFWLLWRHGVIELGRSNEKNPFLTYDSSILGLEYITLSSGATNLLEDRNDIQWRFELPPVLEKPRLKPITGGELQWVPADNRQIPDGALIGGFQNGTLYIIRAPHQGSLTPGKFVPSLGIGYVSWDGREHEKEEFEVLCGFDCTWVPAHEDSIPVNAVIGGYSESREREHLYIGRVLHEGHLICGKIHPSYKHCYIPYGGREIGYQKYEILVSPGSIRSANRIFIEHIDGGSPYESDTEDVENPDINFYAL